MSNNTEQVLSSVPGPFSVCLYHLLAQLFYLQDLFLAHHELSSGRAPEAGWGDPSRDLTFLVAHCWGAGEACSLGRNQGPQTLGKYPGTFAPCPLAELSQRLADPVTDDTPTAWDPFASGQVESWWRAELWAGRSRCR